MEKILQIIPVVITIWFILALIKPCKFMPFLNNPNRIKAIGLFFASVILWGIINNIIEPDSVKAEKAAKAEALRVEQQKQENAKKNILVAMDVVDTLEQAKSVEDALKSVGINEIKSVEYDEVLSDDNTGIKGFRLKTEVHPNIILYMNPNKTVSKIKMAGTPLLDNGKVLASINDFIVTTEEQIKYIRIAEEGVKKVLKAPSSAKFPSYSEYQMSKDNGIITIVGYVDAQNSFGAMIRSYFTLRFNTKENGKLIEFNMDN